MCRQRYWIFKKYRIILLNCNFCLLKIVLLSCRNNPIIVYIRLLIACMYHSLSNTNQQCIPALLIIMSFRIVKQYWWRVEYLSVLSLFLLFLEWRIMLHNKLQGHGIQWEEIQILWSVGSGVLGCFTSYCHKILVLSNTTYDLSLWFVPS